MTPSDTYLKAENIFLTYQIECALEKEDMQYQAFCMVLQKVFSVKRTLRTVQGVKQSWYQLGWKQFQNTDTTIPKFDPQTIIDNLPTQYQVLHKTDKFVKVLKHSDVYSNGDNIIIYITFHENCSYSVQIRGKQINLNEIQISGKFVPNPDGIANACKQIDAIKICQGIIVDKKQYKKQEHILHERLTCNNNQVQVLRSVNCKLVVSLTGRKHPHCNACRRMVVHYEEKTPKNSEDLSTEDTLRRLMPSASQTAIQMMLSQITNSNGANKRKNRWDKSIVSECLNLFTRSPEGYRNLRDSGLLILPSPSMLIAYKNSVTQRPGFHGHIFTWMAEEAERLKIPPEGKIGGILLDEMSIQEGIELEKRGGNLEMVGFTEMGDEGDYLQALKQGKKSKETGTHVLQMLFLGITGFRFPFAHFICKNLNASDIYILFWEAVSSLKDYGFNVKYVCMDGAVNNRSFFNMHFQKKTQVMEKMSAPCPTNPSERMIFMVDPSHTFKKVRNNIIKSGIKKGCTRLLKLQNGYEIQWQMWIDAYQWDKQNPIQIHRALTNEHLFPSNSSKMRNKLAEDVLNTEMLNLMISYKENLGEKGECLNGAIELLQKTSCLINNFRDRRPIHTLADNRLSQNREVQCWFLEWETKTKTSKDVMSSMCHEDIQSSIIAFEQLCHSTVKEKQGWSITPAMINSDPIENTFCQQRGKFNGLNTNPTALQYRRNINGVILGQAAVSRKCNSASGTPRQKCESFKYAVPNKNKTVQKRKTVNTTSHITPIKVIRI